MAYIEAKDRHNIFIIVHSTPFPFFSPTLFQRINYVFIKFMCVFRAQSEICKYTIIMLYNT